MIPPRTLALLLVVLSAPPPAVGAEPAVADVLRICRAALTQGYEGEEAAACDWYVRPCGACGVNAVKSWCIPDGLDRREVAEQVVDGLTALPAGTEPDLAEEVEGLLRRRYPCPDTP